MSKFRVRWGLWLGVFLYAAMHATSALANSGWCPSYTSARQTCQQSEADLLSQGGHIIQSCYVYNFGQYGNGESWGILAYSSYNPYWSGPYGLEFEWLCYAVPPPAAAKAVGKPTRGSIIGEPIDAGTGSVWRDETDFEAGPWLKFARYYSSNPNAGSDTFGSHWRHSYSSHLNFVSGAPGTGTVTVTREDGQVITYALAGGVLSGEPDVFDALSEQTDPSGNPTGWTLQRVDDRSSEQFDATGHLLSVHSQEGFTTTLSYSTASTPTSVAPGAGYLIAITDPVGRAIQLTYNNAGLINQVTAPDGSVYGYSYTGGNLSSITYPDSKTETYLYNEASHVNGATTPALLTGVIDENSVRSQNYSYNAASQATNDQSANGLLSYTVSYNSDGSVDVLDPLGTSRHRSFTTILGVPYPSALDGTCQTCSQTAIWAYDFDGMLNQTTDFNGNVTRYQYDGEGMLTGYMQGVSSSVLQEVQTDWDDTLHVPTERRWLDYNYVPLKKSDWIYNARGQALARCDVDMSVASATTYVCSATGTPPAGVRRQTFTYCDIEGAGCPTVGLLLSTAGPRSDITQTTSFAYAANGDLYQVTDPLGHTTTYNTYDGNGRITQMTDPNGVITSYTYYPRGWLHTRTVAGATTTLTYTPYGSVASISDADSITTSFTYDDAHRLTDITDAQGNVIHYTLDAAGNKTAEQIRNASGAVMHSLSRTYNALGQLTAVVDGLSHTVFNAG